MYKLILLDRDGVINEDSRDYIKSVAEWRPIPGSLEAIAALHGAGRLLGVCTNQAGIGRGILSQESVIAIHEAMQAAVKSHRAELAAVTFCPHHPEAGCDCRKPAPGMLLRLMQALQVPATDTCFVGDSLTDLLAAQAAGVQPVLVRTGNGRQTEAQLVSGQVPALANVIGAPRSHARPPLIFDDLQAVARSFLSVNEATPI